MSPTPHLVSVKPRPWVRVPRGLLADPRLVEVSGTARTLFCALYPEAVQDAAQLVAGGAARGVGWLLTPTGDPASAARLAKVTGLDEADVATALGELVSVGALVVADSRAWGVSGWRVEAESTARVRAHRAARKAATKPTRQRRAAA